MAIDTILVAVGPGDMERTEKLANAAIDVAGPTGATVVLAHVFTDDEFEETLDQLDFDFEHDDVTADDVASRLTTIRNLAELLENADVEYEVRGEVGDHADSIVSLARRVGADRIVVGGRKRSATGKAVFGSVAQEVMMSAACPVTYVRGDRS